MSEDKQNPSPASATEKKPRGPLRMILIGVTALAVLVLGGAIAALGLERARAEKADHPRATVMKTHARSTTSPSATNTGKRASATAASVPRSAAAFVSAIDLAVASVNGQGATSVEIERGGYEVEVQFADGSEVDVFVSPSGKATVQGKRDDPDRTPDPLIATSQVPAIVAAALKATPGAVESISTTDDDGEAFEVTVRQGNGRKVDVHLAADLSVVKAHED